MKIQKLNWAGVKLLISGKTILIDAVEDFSAYKPVLGQPKVGLVSFSDDTKADYIIFTHLHFDHFDEKLIAKCLKPDGKLLIYAALKPLVDNLRANFDAIFLELEETYAEDGISFKPVFAMDGIGDIQSSWIVEGEGMKVFHGGDTMWHNQFWRLGKENKDIDYTFLPANGVTVNFTMIGLEYSPVVASLSIQQAFVAAKLLHAKCLIPMHYGLFERAPYYVPTNFGTQDLVEWSKKMEQRYLLLEDGRYLEAEEMVE